LKISLSKLILIFPFESTFAVSVDSSAYLNLILYSV